LHGILKENGYVIVGSHELADIIVINSCTVKGSTENRIIERFKSLANENKPFVVAYRIEKHGILLEIQGQLSILAAFARLANMLSHFGELV